MIRVDGSATAHGFGLGVALYSGATVIGHNGDLRGFVSELMHLPSLEAHMAVLVNESSFDGLELTGAPGAGADRCGGDSKPAPGCGGLDTSAGGAFLLWLRSGAGRCRA